MSIRLFQILLFIFSINNVLSQTISGKIIDAKRLEPVQYSEVTLYDSNSVIIQIVHTDSNNHFHFSNIPKGVYYINFISPLYINLSITNILLDTSDINLNNISLFEGKYQACGVKKNGNRTSPFSTRNKGLIKSKKGYLVIKNSINNKKVTYKILGENSIEIEYKELIQSQE
ncbi:MAG: hypothetical protein H6586_07155 [Flavobacteriales bacterium]|nr:hypothetical protein [Flavobacteriales bacterium]